MRVADFIFDRLKSEIDTVFYLPGGGCGPLVDALGQSGLRAISCLHEQGAGFAAVGYAQHHGFGVCLVTSGPGITNCVTPIAAAWSDSIPLLVISGQVSTKWLAMPGMRTRGTQEISSVEITQSITKFSWMGQSAADALDVLDKMIGRCKEGRMGPCHLSIPMDIQTQEV